MRVLFFSTYEIVKQSGGVESVTRFLYEYLSDYPFMHLLYSQLLVCQRVCLQNTVCLICK